MHAWNRCLRLIGIVVICAALLGPGGGWSAAAAGSHAAITVHAFWCQASGDELFPECHHWDVNAIDNAEFTVAGAKRWTLNGYVTWTPGAGEQTIQGANLLRYRDVTVVCTNQVTGMILFAGIAAADRVSITTTAGQETICDWYYQAVR
jgi:hypothetical protein